MKSFRLFILLGLLLSMMTLGQSQQPDVSNKPGDKSNKEAVCDGALEIIPSGQMSFLRKRYITSTGTAKARTTKTGIKKRK